LTIRTEGTIGFIFLGGLAVNFEILVQLKDEVLDPEARAIKDTLITHGISGVDGVGIAKRYVISMSGSELDSEQKIRMIAETYLANPVSQIYKIKRLDQ
jgi:phosphoribosylformylglycinamidine synthase PurS subunit